MGKTVLVTGASGLIGQYALAPLKAAGFTIHAIARSPGIEPEVEWITANLLDPQALATLFAAVRPEYLLHLAWDTRPGIYLDDNSNFAWVGASLAMLELFRRYGGRRAVLAGTCFEYEFSGRPLVESGPLAPRSIYAACKNHLNGLAGMFCRKNGISYGWGRVFYVYGARERRGRLTPSVIEAVREKRPLVIRSGPLVRDYMYAGDVAAAFVRLLGGEVEGEVNICTGGGVTIREYCLRLAEEAGGGDVLGFDDRPGEQPRVIVGDNRRLRDEVGFEPLYDLERGLRDLLERETG